MASQKRDTASRWARLAAEALVIFAGVGLALLADDWRETRGEREEAARSLELIERDLARDSVQVARAIELTEEDAGAAQWLLARWSRRAVDSDSVLPKVLELRNGARPAFSRAGFEGLRASNGIRLLGSGELRDSLLHYYEVTQPRFVEYYFDVVWPQIGVGIERMGPHVETSQMAVGGTLALRSSWSVLTSDHSLETQLSLYSGQVRRSNELLSEIQESVESLLGRIRLGSARDRAPRN